MSPQRELLELILSTLSAELNLQIGLERVTEQGGLFAEAAPGYTETMYYDKKCIKVFPVRFLCINENQMYCLETLASICEYLQGLNEYPAAETFQWVNLEVAMEPNKTSGKEEEKFTYTCVVNFKIYY